MFVIVVLLIGRVPILNDEVHITTPYKGIKPRTLINLSIFCSRRLICAAASGLMSVTAWAGPENTNQSVSALSEWLSGDGITGTWGGLRAKLTDRGVEFIGSYDAEGWGNTRGGGSLCR
jgi:hypothetical protein